MMLIPKMYCYAAGIRVATGEEKAENPAKSRHYSNHKKT